MKDFFNSLFESSNERIKNPFIGTYITVFAIYNWRVFFLLIFSDAKIEDKIVVINHEYCNKDAIILPLAISLFYILLLPYLNLIFDRILNYSNLKKEEKKKKGITANMEQKKQEAKYEREIADERAGTREVEFLNNKIDALEKENDLKSQEIIDSMNKSNEDMHNLKLKYDELCAERDIIIDKHHNLSKDNDEIKEIYNLLINQKPTAIRDIKNFLRDNLSDIDFLSLKKHTNNIGVYHKSLPLTSEQNALLLKGNIYALEEDNEHYYMTEDGAKFINDLG